MERQHLKRLMRSQMSMYVCVQCVVSAVYFDTQTHTRSHIALATHVIFVAPMVFGDNEQFKTKTFDGMQM